MYLVASGAAAAKALLMSTSPCWAGSIWLVQAETSSAAQPAIRKLEMLWVDFMGQRLPGSDYRYATLCP